MVLNVGKVNGVPKNINAKKLRNSGTGSIKEHCTKE